MNKCASENNLYAYTLKTTPKRRLPNSLTSNSIDSIIDDSINNDSINIANHHARSATTTSSVKAHFRHLKSYFSSSTLTQSPLKFIDTSHNSTPPSASSASSAAAAIKPPPKSFSTNDLSLTSNSLDSSSSSSMQLQKCSFPKKFYKSLTERRPTLVKSSILKKLHVKTTRQYIKESTTGDATPLLLHAIHEAVDPTPLSPSASPIGLINVAPVIRVATINANVLSLKQRALSMSDLYQDCKQAEDGEEEDVERHRRDTSSTHLGDEANNVTYTKPLTPRNNASGALTTSETPYDARLGELKLITNMLVDMLDGGASAASGGSTEGGQTSSRSDEFTDVSKVSFNSELLSLSSQQRLLLLIRDHDDDEPDEDIIVASNLKSEEEEEEFPSWAEEEKEAQNRAEAILQLASSCSSSGGEAKSKRDNPLLRSILVARTSSELSQTTTTITPRRDPKSVASVKQRHLEARKFKHEVESNANQDQPSSGNSVSDKKPLNRCLMSEMEFNESSSPSPSSVYISKYKNEEKREFQDPGSAFVYAHISPPSKLVTPRVCLFSVNLAQTDGKNDETSSCPTTTTTEHTPLIIANFSKEKRLKEAFNQEEETGVNEAETIDMRKRGTTKKKGPKGIERSAPNCVKCVQNFFALSKSLFVSMCEYIRRR